jgi:hypothetical protein
MSIRFRAAAAWALCAAAISTTHAHAQVQPTSTAGGYVYGAVGRSDYNNDCTGFRDCKNSATASKLGGGYRFASGWAVEGVVLNFGKARATDIARGIKLELQATGAGLAAAHFAELAPKVYAVVRLGVTSMKLEASGRLSNFSTTTSDRSTSLYSSFGVGYAFSNAFYGELAFDATQAKFQGETSRVNAFSAGLGLRF